MAKGNNLPEPTVRQPTPWSGVAEIPQDGRAWRSDFVAWDPVLAQVKTRNCLGKTNMQADIGDAPLTQVWNCRAAELP
jgi:hypothetical protein